MIKKLEEEIQTNYSSNLSSIHILEGTLNIYCDNEN